MGKVAEFGMWEVYLKKIPNNLLGSMKFMKENFGREGYKNRWKPGRGRP